MLIRRVVEAWFDAALATAPKRSESHGNSTELREHFEAAGDSGWWFQPELGYARAVQCDQTIVWQLLGSCVGKKQDSRYKDKSASSC